MKKSQPKQSIVHKLLQRFGFWVLGFFCAFLIVFLLFLFKDISIGELQTDPQPLTSYKEADRYINGLKSLDDETVNEDCRTQFLSHGDKTDRAVIIYHGYTNCPKQFENLGKVLFDRGYNVLIPRMPKHGLKDRMTEELDSLDAKELILFTNETLDIAQGMGTQIDVVGLSGGAVLTSWAIQNRDDINRALIIAPNIQYAEVPAQFALPAARFAMIIPDYYIWWDEDKQEYIEGPDYAYPRLSLRSVGQFFYLGSAVLKQSHDTPPKAERVAVVTNANDEAIHRELLDQLVTNWERSTITTVETFEFDARENLGHDIIDPNQPNAKPGVVYPKLIELLYED